jgi:PBP1b-binding outer membrane lipoprotein LpoB
MLLLIQAMFTASLLLLAACSDNTTAPASITSAPAEVVSAATAPQLETARLNTWLDEQYEEQLAFFPQTRTVLGEKTDNDKLNDYSRRFQRWVSTA